MSQQQTATAPIPFDDIDTLCDVVEAHMEMIGGDDDVSDEEAIERMAWDQAWQRVRAWLRTLP